MVWIADADIRIGSLSCAEVHRFLEVVVTAFGGVDDLNAGRFFESGDQFVFQIIGDIGAKARPPIDGDAACISVHVNRALRFKRGRAAGGEERRKQRPTS